MIFAAPFFALAGVGVWPQSELPLAAALVVAGWTVLQTEKVAWVPLLMASVTIAALPWAPFPLRSWLGHPALGLGGAWWLALAALVAAKRFDLIPAIAALLACALQYSPWSLNSWPDWLAFVAIGLCLGSRGWLNWIAAAVCLLVSQNITAIAALPICAMLAMFWPRRWWYALPLLLAACSSFLILLVQSLASSLLPSLASRAILWKTLLSADRAPAGWGMVDDTMLSGHVFDREWEGLAAGSFSAHNGFLESWLALGWVGLALFALLFVVGARKARSREELTAWCLLAVLSSAWFELPIALPWLALAFARLGIVSIYRLHASFLASLLFLSAFAVAFAAWTSQRLIWDAEAGRPLTPIVEPWTGSPHLWWLLLNIKHSDMSLSKASVEIEAMALLEALRGNADRRLDLELRRGR